MPIHIKLNNYSEVLPEHVSSIFIVGNKYFFPNQVNLQNQLKFSIQHKEKEKTKESEVLKN